MMFQKKLIKKRISFVFVTILILSMFMSTTIMVQAESVGIGKYLTVELTGENFDIPTGEQSGFRVIATKPKTDQEWIFFPAEDVPEQHKVGAGDVNLQAVSADNYEFCRWESDDYSLSEAEKTNPEITIKATKYAEITAVFVKIVPQYTVTFSSQGSGNYWINDLENPLEQTVDEGTVIEIIFDPDSGYHVSAIIETYFDENGNVVDETYKTLYYTNTESYSFTVVSDMNIHIIFEVDGVAYVPPNSENVNVFLSSQVGIEGIITGDHAAFFAGSNLLDMIDLISGDDLVVWQIYTNITTDDGVVVVLHYDDQLGTDESLLRIYKYPSLIGDVNNDGVVNGEDVSIVANAVNTNQQPGWYDPFLDVNKDGYVDDADLHVINDNKGSTINPSIWDDISLWEDVTAYDTDGNPIIDIENNLIYSVPLTDFSIFRCR